MIVIVVSNTIKCFFVLPDNNRSHLLAHTHTHTHMERAETKRLLQTCSHIHSLSLSLSLSLSHTHTHTHTLTPHKHRQHLMRKLLHADMKWLEQKRALILPLLNRHTHRYTHTHFLALVSKFISATSWRVIYRLAQFFYPPDPHQDQKTCPTSPRPPGAIYTPGLLHKLDHNALSDAPKLRDPCLFP